MHKLLKLFPALLIIAVFIPSLLIARTAGDRPLTITDIATMLPLVSYFLILVMLDRITEEEVYFTDEDRRSYRLLAVGFSALLFIMWVLVLPASGIPPLLALASVAGFCFVIYDLWHIFTGLRTTQQLNRIVWLHLGMPFFVAFGLYGLALLYTTWPQVPNPLAIFFILRATVLALDRSPAAQLD